jgi:hypothetical protein
MGHLSNPSQLAGNDRPKSAHGNKTRPSTLMLAFRVNSYRERGYCFEPAPLIENDRGMISCPLPRRFSSVSRSPLETGSLDQRAACVFLLLGACAYLSRRSKAAARSTIARRACHGADLDEGNVRLPSMLAFGWASNQTRSLRLMARFRVKSGTAFGGTPPGALANLLQVNGNISLTVPNSFSDDLAA